MRSMDVTPIPVRMDAGGLDPVDLDRVLVTWDEAVRGCPRFVLSLRSINIKGLSLTPNCVYSLGLESFYKSQQARTPRESL